MYDKSKPWIRRIFSGRSVFIFILVGMAFIWLNKYRMNEPLPVGTKIEDFRLTNIDGVSFNISEIKMPVVLVFYKKHTVFSNFMYNHTYKKLLPQLKFLQDKGYAQIVILTEGYDDYKKVAKLSNEPNHNVLKQCGFASDTKQIAKHFGIRSWPHIFVLNADMTVIFESKLAGAEYIQKILWRN